MSDSDRYTPRHAVETPPVPYFACPCGTTIGVKAFPLAGLFDVEPDDLAWLPDDALDVIEQAVEQHELRAHGVGA